MKWAFWLAAGVVAYTYVGYPLWLWLRARLRPRPVRRRTYEPPVSIVMIARNEERVLEQKLRNLADLNYPAERCQIIVVSDGSNDGTEAILRHHANHQRLHLLLNQLPRGKAVSLNDAIKVAQGEIVVFMDARQKVGPDVIRLLSENFFDPDIGCVSGELMLGDAATGEIQKGIGLYWQVEKRLRELESASGSTVGATGALYAVRRELLATVPEGTILDDVFLPMQVVRQGKRAVFDSRAQAWDQLASEKEFSRKVRTLTGNYQLIQLAPWLLSRSNPIRFEFISHKLMRLLIPFALVVLLITSLALNGALYQLAFFLQIAFYALSILALVKVVRKGPVARVAEAASTFVLLNTAAVVAFANFVRGRQMVWTR
jgi:poly-beta-1,6-N-acetyl-D-glucosamine synthase